VEPSLAKEGRGGSKSSLFGKGGTGWIEKTPLWQRSSRGRESSPGITLLFFDRKTKARLLSQETSPRTQVSTAAYHELDCVIIIIIYEMCYIS